MTTRPRAYYGALFVTVTFCHVEERLGKAAKLGVRMKFASLAGLSALCLSLCGCVAITEGVTQDISVNTNPVGASCIFERQGMNIGTIPSTPATMNIRKTKYDVLIKCNKAGYQEGTYLNHSGVSATIAANVATDILLTAGIASIIDSASGADNKYDSAVNITLIPTAGPTASAR